MKIPPCLNHSLSSGSACAEGSLRASLFGAFPRGLPSSLAELSGHATLLCPARALARRFAIAFGDLPSAALRRISLRPPKSIRWSPVGFMLTEHWPRGTLVTRLYERGSLALSLIRSSGETRAHRSPSARLAFLTVRRLLYSNDSFHSFSPAEFCSAYLSPKNPRGYGKAVHGWHATAYSNGKRRVYVTFEEVKTVGN